MWDAVLFVLRCGGFVGLFFVVNWIEALIISAGYLLTKWLLFRYVLRIRRLNQASAMFTVPGEGNPSYILGATILDHFTLADAEAYFTKFVSFPKTAHMRRRIVTVLGEFYWKDEDNFAVAHHVRTIDAPPFNTPKEALDIMTAHFFQPLNPMLSPWEVAVVQGYQGDKTLMFIRFHHALGDGVSLQHYMSESSEPKGHILQRYITPSLCRDIMIYVLFPVLFPYVLCKVLGTRQPETVLSHHNRPLAGIRRAGVTDTFEIEDLKRVAKRFSATINDLVLTVLLACLRLYLRTQCGVDETSIPLGIAFNLKEQPSARKQLNCQNDFAMFFFHFPMPIITDLDSDSGPAFATVSRQTKRLMKSLLPHSFKLLNLANEPLPHSIGRALIIGPSKKTPIIFTNVAGSRSQLVFGNSKVYDVIYLAPTIGRNAISICVSSYNGHLSVIANSDISRLERPDLLMNMVSQMLSTYVAKYASHTNITADLSNSSSALSPSSSSPSNGFP
jgi:diacylglycerol O-acyltransferase